MSGPLVSVVIPTRNRPELVGHAVRSALAQTVTDLEVVVVIDGPDEATKVALAAIPDGRVRFFELAESKGGQAARNYGVQMALGNWVAMLDDDDEWLPAKLEKQLALASSFTDVTPIVACQVIVDRGIETAVWPTRQPREDEPLSEYVFCRTKPGQGESLIITSMLMTTRELFSAVPFDTTVKRHQDVDWLFRALDTGKAKFVWAWEPLLIFNLQVNQSSVSRSLDAGPSLDWLKKSRLLTKKAYVYFLATQVAPRTQVYKNVGKNLKVAAQIVRGTFTTPRALGISLFFLFTTPQMRNQVVKWRGSSAGRPSTPSSAAS